MKYKYTGRSTYYGYTKVKQIFATKDFGNVKKGQVGGWVERYDNLSQTDNSWIDIDSYVSGTSRIALDSQIISSNIINSTVLMAKLFNVTARNSHINGEKFNNKTINISNSNILSNTIYYNCVDQIPVFIRTLDYQVSYSGVDGSKNHYVSVGCQTHKISDWINPEFRKIIMRKNGFSKSRETEFMHYLNAIIDANCKNKK